MPDIIRIKVVIFFSEVLKIEMSEIHEIANRIFFNKLPFEFDICTIYTCTSTIHYHPVTFSWCHVCTHLKPYCKTLIVRAVALVTWKNCKVHAVALPLSAPFLPGDVLWNWVQRYTYSDRYLLSLDRLAPSFGYSFLMLVNFQFLPSTGTSIPFMFCIYYKQLSSIPK